MTQNDKLVQRLLKKPKDFTWGELVKVLSIYGFEEVQRGKTGGSRRRFSRKDGVVLTFHEPHPSNVLKRYQLGQVIDTLMDGGIL